LLGALGGRVAAESVAGKDHIFNAGLLALFSVMSALLGLGRINRYAKEHNIALVPSIVVVSAASFWLLLFAILRVMLAFYDVLWPSGAGAADG